MPHICDLCATSYQCSLHDTNVRSVMIDEHARACVAQDGEFLSFLQILARNLLQTKERILSIAFVTYCGTLHHPQIELRIHSQGSL
jgi:hypothetical protein